jgi:hypothetical protein
MALTCCNTPEAAYPRSPAPHGGPFTGRIGGIPTHRCPERTTHVTLRRSGPAISISHHRRAPSPPAAAAHLRLHRSPPSSPRRRAPSPRAAARTRPQLARGTRLAASPRQSGRVGPAGRDGTGPGRPVAALVLGRVGPSRAGLGPAGSHTPPPPLTPHHFSRFGCSVSLETHPPQ